MAFQDDRESKRRQDSNTTLWLVAAVVVVGLFVCIALIVVAAAVGLLGMFGVRSTGAVMPALSTPVVSTSVAVAPSSSYDGMTQSVDESGAVGFVIGEPDAPVTVEEYSDFSCSHCQNLAPSIQRIIADYVPTGQVRVVYKPIVFVNPDYSIPAGRAATCAAQQGMFWQMHDEIWNLYTSVGPSAYTQEAFTQAAVALGLDEAEFTACFESQDTADALTAVLDEAESRGINATPTLFVNDQEVTYTGPDAIYADLARAIETALDGRESGG